MAKCGCTSDPVCGCILVADGTTTTVVGTGAIIAPYEVSIIGQPNPRPAGLLYGGGQALTAAISNIFVASGAGGGATVTIPTMFNAGQPTRLVAPLSGTYYICAGSQSGITPVASSTAVGWRLRLNGTTVLGTQMTNWDVSSSGGGNTISTVHRLVSTDYLEMIIYSFAGGSSLVDGFLEMIWMGA